MADTLPFVCYDPETRELRGGGTTIAEQSLDTLLPLYGGFPLGYVDDKPDDPALWLVSPASVGEPFLTLVRRELPQAIADHRMEMARKEARERAFAYGNSVTAQITGRYSEAEVKSWDKQERDARLVLAGEPLPPDEIITGLAEDAGKELVPYAQGVVAKADAYRQIARAAVKLRRAADGLLSPAIDTPAKLDQAVTQLKAECDAIAAQLFA